RRRAAGNSQNHVGNADLDRQLARPGRNSDPGRAADPARFCARLCRLARAPGEVAGVSTPRPRDEAPAASRRGSRTMNEIAIETRDLSVFFGGVSAVNNVNFTLRERELRCLIGPNGAGKSTFFKSITGQLRGADSRGRVLIRGEEVTNWPTYRIMRLGVGVKTQVPSVMSGLTTEENLWLSASRTNPDAAEGIVEEIVNELA